MRTTDRTPRAAVQFRAVHGSRINQSGAMIAAAVVGIAALVTQPSTAMAEEVSPTGKGIAGGVLLGAEAVTLIEAAAKVRAPWAYTVGALAGAAAGGVGGFLIEENVSDGYVPTYMLAGGLALVIPTLIATLNAASERYDDVDREGIDDPSADPGAPAGKQSFQTPKPRSIAHSESTTRAVASKASSTSLVDVRGGGELRLGVPVPEVRPMYTMSDLKQYGMQQQTELRMPILKVAF